MPRNAPREETKFKLAKVEAYNRQAAAQGFPQIEYKAEWVSLPGGERALDFTFLKLAPEQFLAVRDLYGGFSPLEPSARASNYKLSDFMPPMIQALIGHRFEYIEGRVPEINEGRKGFELKWGAEGNVSERVTVSVNCWGTVYGAIQGFAANAAPPEKFTAFFTGRFQADAFFSKLGESVGRTTVPKGRVVRLPKELGAQTGDFLMLYPERQWYLEYETNGRGHVFKEVKGRREAMLEHLAIYIDEGLVFEKSNGGSYDPFRFMPLSLAAKDYVEDGPLEIQVRRYRGGKLPPAQKTFGGSAFAIDPRYKKPLPEYMNSFILHHREPAFPVQDQFFEDHSYAVDVKVILNEKTGRYELAPEAYERVTYDVRKILERAKCMTAAGAKL